MTVVSRFFVAGLVPRFRTGNLDLGFALMVRAVLRPEVGGLPIHPRPARNRQPHIESLLYSITAGNGASE